MADDPSHGRILEPESDDPSGRGDEDGRRAQVFQPPRDQGNGLHDGYQSSFSLPAQPTLKWSFDFGDDVSYPVIGGGHIFVIVSGTGGSGSPGYGTRLYAMSEATGKVAWGPIELGGTYWKAGLAYDSGKVFTLNFDGALTAYGATTGTVEWSDALTSQYEFAGPPVVQNGIVVVEGAGSGSTTYGVNESTGKLLWSASGRGGQISPDVSGTTVYVTDGCGADAMSLTTGASIWDASDACSTGSARTAVVHGDDLYSPTYTGSGVIRSTANGATVGSYAASTEPAFAGSTSFRLEGVLSAVNAAGTTVWTQAGDNTLASAPVIAGTSVYDAGTSGVVAAYDVSTGTETWHATLPDGYTPPDEQNFSSPLTGLGIGDHLLIVPSGTYLAVYG